jgi:gamma-glutamyl:cysteine ligase YbdK (ATP-grasp superfamily)
VPPADFAATLDAAHLVSAPVLALAANSPYFLQRRLWDDTRIPLFTQAVCGAHMPQEAQRVFLARGWTRTGAADAFGEDVRLFPPILPVLFDADPDTDPPALHELRLHAGSIWRWNRPVYDPSGSGHVRIEFRALPTGPTIVDMIGNAALIVGAALALAPRAVARWLPFAEVRANLDAAAHHGLDAELAWPSPDGGPPRRTPVRDVLAELLPAARDALLLAGVAAEDADAALQPVHGRLRRGSSGARWQTAAVARREPASGRVDALAGMLQSLLEYGFDGPPVADWSR